MIAQLKYSFRCGLSLRTTMLLISLAINLGFLLAWQLGARHIAVQIVAVVLSGVSLTAVLVGNIIADVASFRQVFRAPTGYSLMLAPVKGWKILAGRVIATVVCDCVSLIAGIVGVVLHAYRLGSHSEYYKLGEEDFSTEIRADFGGDGSLMKVILLSILIFVLYYLVITLLISFGEALRTGVFHRVRGGGALAVISAIFFYYLLTFSWLLLMPFGAVERYGLFVNINLAMSLYPGSILFFLLLLAQSAVLFALTSRIIERRVNL